MSDPSTGRAAMLRDEQTRAVLGELQFNLIAVNAAWRAEAEARQAKIVALEAQVAELQNQITARDAQLAAEAQKRRRTLG